MISIIAPATYLLAAKPFGIWIVDRDLRTTDYQRAITGELIKSDNCLKIPVLPPLRPFTDL
jgi:hypothetical protein